MDTSELLDFDFFRSRPLESKENIIAGEFEDSPGIDWEISDIVFDEGAMLSKEVYKTTMQLIHLPKKVPTFVLQQEAIFDKLFDRVLFRNGQKDIDFQGFPSFSNDLSLKGEDEKEIRKFFTPNLIRFLEMEEIYHIECNGDALIVFKSLRIAKTGEIKNMLRFSEDLVRFLD